MFCAFGYLNMEPFNIKIEQADQFVTLTILPVNTELFKIVYFGGILCGIRKESNQQNWEAVSAEDLPAGDLPFYQKDDKLDHQPIELDSSTLLQIGQAIEEKLSVELIIQKSHH